MKIKQEKLAQYKHVKFLMNLEKQSAAAYKIVMAEIIDNIKKNLKKDKLAKSDDELKTGWTGEVPRIEVDMDKTVANVVDKYMQAMRWVMLGDYAGKDARKMAEQVGLVGKITPGLIPSAYLQSIDAHREHHEDVIEEEAPEMPKDLLKETMNSIVKRADRFLKSTFEGIKNAFISAVDRIVSDTNYKNLNTVHEEAHDNLPVKGEDAVSDALDLVKDFASMKGINKELKTVVETYESKWDTVAQTELATSSAMGTHQAIYEIYGTKDDGVRVVWMTMENERVCTFCNQASKNPDGSYKYYSPDSFRPTGYNYGKKKSEWVLTVPPSHPNCFCDLVYVPPGFEVDKNGTITKRR